MVSSMVAPTVSVKAADKEKLIVAYKDSDSTGAKYMEQWINSTYENWADKDKVDLELQPIVANDSDYATKIQVEMQDKDTCPDIFFEDTFQLNTDVAAGYVADITDKVNAWDEWDSSFIEALKEGTKGSDGQTYAVPVSTDVRGLWYNKDVMEEAAWIDGCSRFQGIFKVILPLMLPGVCTVGIYTFSGCWGNFFVPFILLSASEKYSASVMLYQFFSQHSVAYGELAAYSVIYTLPSIILYVITQKWMSKGFSLSGADKG